MRDECSVGVSPQRPGRVVRLLFRLCVVFLDRFGRMLGLDYVRISVIVNLWLQGGVLVLSSAVPLVAIAVGGSERCARPAPGIAYVVASAWLLLNVCLFLLVLRRYRLPFRRAFSLCAADLSRLSRAVGCSYHLLNLLLFVVVYVIAVCFNLLPALLLLT